MKEITIDGVKFQYTLDYSGEINGNVLVINGEQQILIQPFFLNNEIVEQLKSA